MSAYSSVQFALYARTRLEREALESIVVEHCHARVTSLCEDLASAIVLADAGQANVLIADLSAAEATVDARDLHALTRVSQRARVILIISRSARTKEFRPLFERADGCMASEEGAGVLADAVACVLAGGTFKSPGAERLLSTSIAGISQLALGTVLECRLDAPCLLPKGFDSSHEKRERRVAGRFSYGDQPAMEVNL